MSDNHFDVSGEPDEVRWRLRAGNNQVVAESGQTFGSLDAALDSIERVRRLAGDTPTVRGSLAGGDKAPQSVDLLLEDSGADVEHQLRRCLDRIRAFEVTVPSGAGRDALKLFAAELEDVLRRFAAERISRDW